MLSCRKGPWLRMLALLGVVLLAGHVGAVQAAGISQPPEALADTDVNTTPEDVVKFPFMSVDLKQANMLANAFMFQMRLFTGATGQGYTGAAAAGSLGGGFAAMRYLALMAVMIGAILILFFKKYQRVAVIIPWFLVVLISVFVPLGSKLLFYPITVKLPPSLSGSGEFADTESVHDGTKTCIQRPEGCGFTPQLVAIHLGSTMQMIVSDIFRSNQWTGLLERQAAATRLYQLPDFDMGPAWYSNSQAFGDSCGSLHVRNLLPTAAAAPAAAAASLLDAPMRGQKVTTLDDVIREYRWLYYGEGAPDRENMPPMIVLPETKQMAQDFGWSDNVQKEYLNKLTLMYNSHSLGNDGYFNEDVNKVVFENPQSNEITAVQALDGMESLYAQSTGWGGQSIPRMIWSGGYTPLSMMFMRGSQVGNSGQGVDLATRWCYVRNKMGIGRLLDDTVRVQASTDCVTTGAGGLSFTPLLSPSDHQNMFIQFYRATHPSDANPADNVAVSDLKAPWAAMAKLYGKVKDMPVGYGVPSYDLASGGGTGYDKVYVVSATASPQCGVVGKQLVNSAILSLGSDWSAGKQSAKYFDNLEKLLDGTTTAIPTKLDWDDISSQPTNGFVDEKNQMIWNMVNYLNEELRGMTMRVPSTHAPDDTDRREALMVGILKLMDHVTPMMHNMVPEGGDALAAANDDAKQVRVVGSQTLSGIGGMLATYLSKGLTAVLATVTGPLAVAFVYFVNILVDMVLMAMITLTPFLFLMGLVIPTTSAGILMITVMSVFILKFVPVTMIILNALGGMMYDLLPASFGPNADFARNLLIIAMSGMYMSVVGLTFFLMFKLGDPAAFLGRLVALDSAAKQIADRGWDAAKTLAGAAVAIAAGGATGGFAGMIQGARKFAPGGAGVDSLLAAAQNGLREEKRPSDGTDGKDTDTNPDGTDPLAPDGAASAMPETDAAEDSANALGDGMMSPEKRNALLEEQAGDGQKLGDFAEFNVGEGETKPFTTADGVTHSVSKQDGRTIIDGHDMNTGAFIGGAGGEAAVNQEIGGEDGVTLAGSGAARPAGTLAGSAPQPPAGRLPGDPISSITRDQVAQQREDARSAAGGLREEQRAPEQVSNQPRQPSAMEQNVAQRGGAAGGAGATVAGRPVGEMQAAQDVLRGPEASAAAAAGAAQVGQPGAVRSEAVNQALAANNAEAGRPGAAVTGEAIPQALQQRVDERAANMAKANPSLVRNLNDRVADVVVSAQAMLADDNVKWKTGEEEKVKSILSNFEKMDTAAMTQGELLATLGSVNNLQAAMALRGKGDNRAGSIGGQAISAMFGDERAGGAVEGAVRGTLSGLYGSFTGVFGSGGGSIPIIGPAIREIANEWYQAPERARAWNMAGGFGKWMTAKGDAERLKFYNQEMAPLVSGHQYQEMGRVGGFQAQYDVARQAASEAVARTRSNYNILNDATGGRGIFSADQLAGIGSMDAAARLGALRGEAAMMQGPTAPVKVAVVDAKGNLTGETKQVNVALTPQVLNEIQGGIGVKRAGSNMSDMLLAHYPIVEKQYLRGDPKWDAARGMAHDGAAARAFITQDVDTDYTVEGHIKMVTGKMAFKQFSSEAETLVRYRNQDNAMLGSKVSEYLKAANNDVGQAFAAALKDSGKNAADFIPANFAGDVRAAQMSAIQKMAKGSLGPANLRLESLFEASSSRGSLTYPVRVLQSRFADEEETLVRENEKARTNFLRQQGLPRSAMRAQPFMHKGKMMSLESAENEFFDVMQTHLMKQAKLSRQQAAEVATEWSQHLGKTVQGMDQNARKALFQAKRVGLEQGYTVDKDTIGRVNESIKKDNAVSSALKGALKFIFEVGGKDGMYKKLDMDKGQEESVVDEGAEYKGDAEKEDKKNGE